jgi:crotonobetainyl-CoA:carnitine CoA-transferase CaiB-like acyl-CoA transferase
MQNSAAFRAELSATLGLRPAAEVIAGLLAEEAPAAKVNEREDLPTDPQIMHNETILEIDHADLGRVRQPRHPARFFGTPTAAPGPAPHLGEHTAAVLAELRGEP